MVNQLPQQQLLRRPEKIFESLMIYSKSILGCASSSCGDIVYHVAGMVGHRFPCFVFRPIGTPHDLKVVYRVDCTDRLKSVNEVLVHNFCSIFGLAQPVQEWMQGGVRRRRPRGGSVVVAADPGLLSADVNDEGRRVCVHEY